MLSDDVLWCSTCGSFSPSRAVGLARECPGRPDTSGRLARLLRGVHPVSGKPIGSPLAEVGIVPAGFVRPPRQAVRRDLDATAAGSTRFASILARVRAKNIVESASRALQGALDGD